MRQSMTGFASAQGAGEGMGWTWELRGVNGKGLDLRLRLPDGIDGLETQLRQRLAARLSRGNVQVSLRLAGHADESAPRLDAAQLTAVLDAMARIEARAMEAGLSLAPSTAADIVGLRGILTTEPEPGNTEALHAAILTDFDTALAAFVTMRETEGAQLFEILTRQLDEIAALVDAAEAAIAARAEAQGTRLQSQLARVLDNSDGIDADRLTQEIALIAVKSDVTEEIDRLRAHVNAARALLRAEGAVGRKLDFLMQEFNREANTLCAKSGDAGLTQIGLALKTVIDQMREQVQNVE